MTKFMGFLSKELSLFGCVKRSDEWMSKVVGETLQVRETKNQCKKRVEKATWKEKFWEKRLHGTFMRGVSELAADESLCQWL